MQQARKLFTLFFLILLLALSWALYQPREHQPQSPFDAELTAQLEESGMLPSRLARDLKEKGLSPSSLVWPIRCPSGTNFHANLRERFLRRADSSEAPPSEWYLSVDDKLKGYEFADLHGVATPKVLGCFQSAVSLPATWPLAWGQAFVIKPLGGFNSKGVVVVSDGNMSTTGAYMRGRLDYLRQLGNFQEKAGEAIIVEEAILLRGIVDFKFYMFGDVVGGVHVIMNRNDRPGARQRQRAWVDKHFRRVDRFGCTRLHNNGVDETQTQYGYATQYVSAGSGDHISPTTSRGGFAPCTDERLSQVRPPFWDTMVSTAKHLGSSLGGAFMRVDMYAGADGPVLGEFTPFPTHGKVQCVIPKWPNDTCFLGRLWRDTQSQIIQRPESLCRALKANKRLRRPPVLPPSCRAVVGLSTYDHAQTAERKTKVLHTSMFSTELEKNVCA